MKRLKARIRGVIGLGVIGALVGFVAGALWGLASSVVRSGVSPDPDYFRFLWSMSFGNAVGFMKIGGFTTAGFGVLTAYWDAAWSFLPIMGVLGVIGGVLTTSMVATAKRANRNGLAASRDSSGA